MGLTSSTIEQSADSWVVTVTLDYNSIRITYTINSTGLIQKKIVSDDGREVIFNVDAVTYEMVDLTKAHVGKDGNFDSCLFALRNLVMTMHKRWDSIDTELKSYVETQNEISIDYRWVIDIKIPSDAKVVDYTITSDNETIVKKVTCTPTQKSTVFNVDLIGNTKMVDDTPTGSDGELSKMLAVVTNLCSTMAKY